MSRPRSPAMIAAIRMVREDGYTAYRAAKLNGLQPSSVSRAVAPPKPRAARPCCPTCGRPVRQKKPAVKTEPEKTK